ncbi:MAG: malate synthase G, partial [Boseongicola sp.]
MTERVERSGLKVSQILADFIENEALPESGVDASAFWQEFAALLTETSPRNRELLAEREKLQNQIDDWHRRHRNQPHSHTEYKAFLEEIGYLVPEGEDFQIDTRNVDPEIATVPGPQLVVPITNARYSLNAANARWGSLYDAFYGTDVIDGKLPTGGYD